MWTWCIDGHAKSIVIRYIYLFGGGMDPWKENDRSLDRKSNEIDFIIPVLATDTSLCVLIM